MLVILTEEAMLTESKKSKFPEKNELIFTRAGFGIKTISKETIRKNFEAIKQMAAEARAVRAKKALEKKNRDEE